MSQTSLSKTVRKANKKAKAKPKVSQDAKRDEATLEVLRSINKSVAVIAGKDVPAPVVNIPERKPVSYEAKFTRNSRGDMVAARIDPVID